MSTAALKPDRVFRALADKTRLRILYLLLSGELCVCDIVSSLDCPQPTASRHLAYLRRAGLVTVRKDGIWSHYRLALESSDFELAVRNCIECCSGLPKLAQDARRLRISQAKCCE